MKVDNLLYYGLEEFFIRLEASQASFYLLKYRRNSRRSEAMLFLIIAPTIQFTLIIIASF